MRLLWKAVLCVLIVGVLSDTSKGGDKDGTAKKGDKKNAAPYKEISKEVLEELSDSYEYDGEIVDLSEDDYEKPKDLLDQVHLPGKINDHEDDHDDAAEAYDDEPTTHDASYDDSGEEMPPPPPFNGFLPPWMRFPMPNLPPMPWLGYPFSGPPTGPPPPNQERYMRPMEGTPVRHRRSVDFWDDVDSGFDHEVSDTLMHINPGYASYVMASKQMDLYGPPLHVGKINRGILMNPELENNRAFGKGMDFNAEDMSAFHYMPHGQHIALDHQQLENYLKKGFLPIGKKFIVSAKLLNHFSKCWFSKATMNIPAKTTADAFSHSERKKYWFQASCKVFRPGVYELVALKRSGYEEEYGNGYQDEDHEYGYDYKYGENNYDKYPANKYSDNKYGGEYSEHYVIFMKAVDSPGKYIAIEEFNPVGLQEWSPLKLMSPYTATTEQYGSNTMQYGSNPFQYGSSPMQYGSNAMQYGSNSNTMQYGSNSNTMYHVRQPSPYNHEMPTTGTKRGLVLQDYF